jgi:hypothetical protein
MSSYLYRVQQEVLTQFVEILLHIFIQEDEADGVYQEVGHYTDENQV